MTHINDRHADEHLSHFSKLVENIIIQGIDVSKALRQSFFTDCLQSSTYQRYSKPNVLVLKRFSNFAYAQNSTAEVAFVRMGKSQRERDQIDPIMNWLSTHGNTASEIHNKTYRSRLRATFDSFSPINPLTSSDRTTLTEIAMTIQREFQLSDAFVHWLDYQIVQLIYKYRAASQLLSKTAPKVVVLTSEYFVNARPLLIAARKLGIKTVFLQHGFLGQEWLYHPLVSDRICVWGEVDRQWLMERSVDEQRIVVTGSNRAFCLDEHIREAVRREYDVQSGQKVGVFFSPNLTEAYHQKAYDFLLSTNGQVRWMIRPHPSAHSSRIAAYYHEMDILDSQIPLIEALSLADIAVHDFSTMAFAQYAGVSTACLALDGPYPDYYPALLGDQPIINTPGELDDLIDPIEPMAELTPKTTSTMAAGQEEALLNIGIAIRELL
ncbi:MAG: hypothetical protein L0154_20875 [Chloroflexi bacterium]|nr:hypothetical protein [Chloroflexota bacterium]